MKKVILATIAFIVMDVSANAADIPVKAVDYAHDHDWSGIYFGASAGWMRSTIYREYPYSNFVTGNGVGNHTLHDNDAVLAFHGGIQQQWGNFVLGFEGGIAQCIRGCQSMIDLSPAQGFAAGGSSRTRIGSMHFVGGRLGYAWDRWMVYGTGGAMTASLKGEYCNVNTSCPITGAFASPGYRVNHGWYAGVGGEYVWHRGTLVDGVVGLEYVHWSVGAKDNICFNGNCNIVDDTLRAKGDMVRLRLTLKTKGWDILRSLTVAAR